MFRRVAPERYRCELCQRTLSSSEHSTSNLWLHLRRLHVSDARVRQLRAAQTIVTAFQRSQPPPPSQSPPPAPAPPRSPPQSPPPVTSRSPPSAPPRSPHMLVPKSEEE